MPLHNFKYHEGLFCRKDCSNNKNTYSRRVPVKTDGSYLTNVCMSVFCFCNCVWF